MTLYIPKEEKLEAGDASEILGAADAIGKLEAADSSGKSGILDSENSKKIPSIFNQLTDVFRL